MGNVYNLNINWDKTTVYLINKITNLPRDPPSPFWRKELCHQNVDNTKPRPHYDAMPRQLNAFFLLDWAQQISKFLNKIKQVFIGVGETS